jgi:hypothetical protein
MSVTDSRAMTALIERICDAHIDRDPDGPLCHGDGNRLGVLRGTPGLRSRVAAY